MKAYNVMFRFAQPQAGAIPLPANSKEEAMEKMKSLLAHFVNVEVLDAVEVPLTVLADGITKQDLIEEAEVIEPEKVN